MLYTFAGGLEVLIAGSCCYCVYTCDLVLVTSSLSLQDCYGHYRLKYMNMLGSGSMHCHT